MSLERDTAFPKPKNFEVNMSTWKAQPHFKQFNIATVYVVCLKR